MRVGLIDVDGHNFPNLPLMKLSAWHKAQGDHVEWYEDCAFEYGEYSQPGKGRKSFCINSDDVLRITPRRPHDPSWYHNDPLCPSCRTYMIYHFEHCPKCGQKLDWSEEVRL